MPAMTREIATDLLTPLGAYLRLRDGARAAFLLRVRGARAPRATLVRQPWLAARRLRRGRREAMVVVGYLGYDVVARPRARPCLPLRRRASRKPFRRTASCSSASTIRAARRRGARRRLGRGGALTRGPAAGRAARNPGCARGTAALPQPGRVPDVGHAREGAHPRGGRVSSRDRAAAGRPTSASAFELYRALRQVNPSPYLFLLELDDVALRRQLHRRPSSSAQRAAPP